MRLEKRRWLTKRQVSPSKGREKLNQKKHTDKLEVKRKSQEVKENNVIW